jgi:hypothetical protein
MSQNGAVQMQLNHEQLASLLLIENLLATMQLAANQLGGFLKYEPAANAVLFAHQTLTNDYARLRQSWERSIVIAPASAVIEGKKIA